MRRDIPRRLVDLEQRTPSGSSDEDREAVALLMLEIAIISVVKGERPRPSEDITQGHARVLGFPNAHASYEAMHDDFDEWMQRHARAWSDLCAEHGIDEASSEAERDDFFMRMAARDPQIEAELRTVRAITAAARPGTAVLPAGNRPH